MRKCVMGIDPALVKLGWAVITKASDPEQQARKLAKKVLRKCGLIWSSHESRYIEIMAEALLKFREEGLKKEKHDPPRR